MNKIEKRQLEKELKYNNTTILTYRIEYPEITNSYYEYGKQTFNKYYKEKAIMLQKYINTQLYEEAKETYRYNIEHNYPTMVYDVISVYNVTYNEQQIVSLYENMYQFTGGAHGSTIRTSQTWNLQVAEILPLSYFNYNNPYYIINILKEINKQIEQQIEEGKKQYFDNYCELVLQTFNVENFYILPNTIVIYFQQYDIAPYSSGIPVFLIQN